MISEVIKKTEIGEDPNYFSVPGGHLYTVLHAAENPVARVLLVGSFAAERHLSYQPWVCWTRRSCTADPRSLPAQSVWPRASTQANKVAF